ncbi:MAG: BlaI/MecI/CopY family transcriptional regulator [Lachnospiraceae bacterium]|nr:BlaI/MecI/CopY family transcriptional regulator [Lachnospiraceae bacterium]
MKFSLTSMEHAIMMFFWENKRWASGAELWEYLNRSGKNCKRQTVNTYLTRMAEKGILTKNGTKYMYTYTEKQFEAERAREVLDDVYQGTLKNFFAALTGGARITKEEKEELKAYLDSLDDESRQ